MLSFRLHAQKCPWIMAASQAVSRSQTPLLNNRNQATAPGVESHEREPGRHPFEKDDIVSCVRHFA